MFTASCYFIGFCKAFQLEDRAAIALADEQNDSPNFTVFCLIYKDNCAALKQQNNFLHLFLIMLEGSRLHKYFCAAAVFKK